MKQVKNMIGCGILMVAFGMLAMFDYWFIPWDYYEYDIVLCALFAIGFLYSWIKE